MYCRLFFGIQRYEFFLVLINMQAKKGCSIALGCKFNGFHYITRILHIDFLLFHKRRNRFRMFFREQFQERLGIREFLSFLILFKVILVFQIESVDMVVQAFLVERLARIEIENRSSALRSNAISPFLPDRKHFRFIIDQQCCVVDGIYSKKRF